MLQFELPYYETWYDLLNLGLRLAPGAGTDFPCGPAWSIPGRERFYTRLEARPTHESWREAVRAGRTFVAESGCFALRVAGDKVGEAPIPAALPGWAVAAGDRYMDFREQVERSEAFFAARGRTRPSAAHTAPI